MGLTCVQTAPLSLSSPLVHGLSDAAAFHLASPTFHSCSVSAVTETADVSKKAKTAASDRGLKFLLLNGNSLDIIIITRLRKPLGCYESECFYIQIHNHHISGQQYGL